MTAIARAPEGGVLVHCHAGKDRTGVVVALLLALAGVPAETIAADYALSERYLQPLYRQLMAETQDPVERERLAQEVQSPPEIMLAVLSWLETTGRGIERYLLDSGMEPDDLQRLRRRLIASG
jgi:protein tyrosine/serine phosphatase